MKVAKNSFIHKVEDVPEAIQEQFTELTTILLQKMSFTLANQRSFGLKCNIAIQG